MIAKALYLGELCEICMKPLRADQKLSLDHIIPTSVGGSDHRSNLRVTHLRCNVRRGNRLPPIKDMSVRRTSRAW
jgi:5-methylcytosine-specific restriction endonuclease McrA